MKTLIVVPSCLFLTFCLNNVLAQPANQDSIQNIIDVLSNEAATAELAEAVRNASEVDKENTALKKAELLLQVIVEDELDSDSPGANAITEARFAAVSKQQIADQAAMNATADSTNLELANIAVAARAEAIAADAVVDSLTEMFDQRDSFDVDFNLGIQFNNFTTSNLDQATNPAESGENGQSELLDIRVNYRLNDNLWLYGNTTRTSRGTDALCKDNNNAFLGCPINSDSGETGGGDNGDGMAGIDEMNEMGGNVTTLDPNRAFQILANAESIEARVGLRYEFAPFPNNQIAPGSYYVSIEQGFASVEDRNDIAQINQIGFGVIATEGRFRNSFLELGYGKNELFIEDPSDRYKAKVHLEYIFSKDLIGFIESEVDFDSGTGNDSVRTMIGFEIPVTSFLEAFQSL